MLDQLLDWSVVITWIFGGCCSNVYTLESIIKSEPDSGLLITFAQFILTALLTYPNQASSDPTTLFLKPRAVPTVRWIPSIIMFFVVNMMNNYAFGYKISVPVHIILRSGGSVMTMVVGWIWGKTYSRTQVTSVILLTIGISIAAMADAQAKGTSISASSSVSLDRDFLAGLTLLFIAQLLSAIMGLYVQLTYAKYGSHWHENLFYSHFLSLPLFIPFLPSLAAQLHKLRASPHVQPLSYLTPTTAGFFDSQGLNKTTQLPPIVQLPNSPTVPKLVIALFANALTQYACIRGVNLLASKTSAVGVSIALNVRKLVSLFISIIVFGNVLPVGVQLGAAVVFASAGLWAWEEGRLGRERRVKIEREKSSHGLNEKVENKKTR